LATVPNQLYFGDNLDVLRKSIKDETIDLIYLDPPFNSNASYNVLFASPKGEQSGAQIHAFEDTWHWGEEAEKEFGEILTQTNTQVAEVIRALRQFLGENDMMAYLVMMASRLLELHRVLKPTGSLYLHCDPTACHYLKIVLDGVFGLEFYRNEITWKRTFAHGNVGRNYGSITDNLLFYSKGREYTWNQQFAKLSAAELDEKYPMKDSDGRRWQSVTLRNPGVRPNLHFPYTASNGITYQPHPNGWSCNLERLQKYDAEGRLHFPAKPDGALRLKMYEDESPGERLQNIWGDIPPISANAAERLGYPTQKPIALLERIVNTSSNPGDLVLDPFCGCGTAVHAAQKLGREWVGIDVTHLAVSLIEKRLRDAFPGINYEVHGTPKDYEGARNLAERDKYEFQYWACSLVNAQPYQGKKKGADGGVDGLIFFQDDKEISKKIVVSVKGGENVGVTMVKDLIATCQRQKAEIGLFVTLNPPTKPMVSEALAAGFYTSPTGKKFPKIQILAVQDLLEGKDAARYPSLDAGGLTFKKAQIEQGEDKQHSLFDAPQRASRQPQAAERLKPQAAAKPVKGKPPRR
jgi:site-specific DNA-methyltransferase (adenine-specific)